MITIDMIKAKAISHDIRRARRAEAFAPLDIQATIPAKAVEAEAKRQVIRDSDAALQANIDNATSDKELKNILGL